MQAPGAKAMERRTEPTQHPLEKTIQNELEALTKKRRTEHFTQKLAQWIHLNDSAKVTNLLKNNADPNGLYPETPKGCCLDQKGTPFLIKAIIDGFEEIGCLLITYGANPNTTMRYYIGDLSALYFAVDHKRCAIFQKLLEAGAHITGEPNNAYNNPLWRALDKNKSDIFKLLLEHRAKELGDEQAKKNELNALLIRAIKIDNQDACLLLIQHGADVSTCFKLPKGAEGWTLLMHASQKGWLEICKLLISKGVNVNASLTNHARLEGWTALMEAIDYNHIEICKLLIKHGADVNAMLPGDHPLLINAIIKGFEEIGCLLITHAAHPNTTSACVGGDLSALYFAVDHKRCTILQKLLEAGAHITGAPGEHHNPLWCALDSKENDMFKLLLEHRAKEPGDESANKNELNALLIRAIQDNNQDACSLLIQHGADVNTCFPEKYNYAEGWTLLMHASQMGLLEICTLLLEHGADANAITMPEGSTALIEAAYIDNREICELLLKHGASANAMTSDGYTALQITNSVEICEMLLGAQAAIDASNDNGDTPLIIHTKLKNEEICTLLKSRGANTEIRNKMGLTAQDYQTEKIIEDWDVFDQTKSKNNNCTIQ